MQGGAVTEVSAHEPPLSVRGVRVRKRRIELGSKRYASFHRRGVMCTNMGVGHSETKWEEMPSRRFRFRSG